MRPTGDTQPPGLGRLIDMLIASIHSTSLPLFPSIKATASETVIKPCGAKRLPAAFNEATLILPLFAIGLPIASLGLETNGRGNYSSLAGQLVRRAGLFKQQ